MHRLLSNRGYQKYQQIKLAEPSKELDMAKVLAEPSKPASKFPKLVKLKEEGKSLFKESPLSKMTLGKLKVPTNTYKDKLDNIILANPHISNLPGSIPDVKGMAVGFKF